MVHGLKILSSMETSFIFLCIHIPGHIVNNSSLDVILKKKKSYKYKDSRLKMTFLFSCRHQCLLFFNKPSAF